MPTQFEDTMAFPSSNTHYGGMTLRDYFADSTMRGIVGSISTDDQYDRIRRLGGRDGITVSQWIAREAYKQADAMLAERAKQGK